MLLDSVVRAWSEGIWVLRRASVAGRFAKTAAVGQSS